MGASDARVVTPRRPKWRAYLRLSRLSNLPTVWTNVLAGMLAARVVFDWHAFANIAVAASLFYTAGMFLNDAFDVAFDAERRPDRPIPSGDASRREVFGVGFLLLFVAEAWLAASGFADALVWGVALATAILYYNYRHKRDPLGPMVMGLCRGLVYCVAAAAISGGVGLPVLVAAAVLTAYVVGLTWVAKRAGPHAGWLIPQLIAGISIVDAAVGLANGGGALALVAVAGFVLTLAFQRLVPGT